MTQLDTGSLYITSTRVLSDGTKRDTSIALAKITNFTVFKDGLQIEKETGPDQYFVGSSDWELAGRAWTVPFVGYGRRIDPVLANYRIAPTAFGRV